MHNIKYAQESKDTEFLSGVGEKTHCQNYRCSTVRTVCSGRLPKGDGEQLPCKLEGSRT